MGVKASYLNFHDFYLLIFEPKLLFTSDWLGWNFEIRSATLTAEGTVGERLSRSVELDLNFLKIKNYF